MWFLTKLLWQVVDHGNWPLLSSTNFDPMSRPRKPRNLSGFSARCRPRFVGGTDYAVVWQVRLKSLALVGEQSLCLCAPSGLVLCCGWLMACDSSPVVNDLLPGSAAELFSPFFVPDSCFHRPTQHLLCYCWKICALVFSFFGTYIWCFFFLCSNNSTSVSCSLLNAQRFDQKWPSSTHGYLWMIKVPCSCFSWLDTHGYVPSGGCLQIWNVLRTVI